MSWIDVQPVDLAILLVSAAACVYCFALSRRLRALQDTRDGLGSSIKAFSQSVSAVSNSTHEARLQTGHMVAQLSQLMTETEQKCDSVRQLMRKVESREHGLADKIRNARLEYESLVAEIEGGRHKTQLATDAAHIESVISAGKQELEYIQKIASDLLSEAEQLTQEVHRSLETSQAESVRREHSATQHHQELVEKLAAAEASTLTAMTRSREEIEKHAASIREERALIQAQQRSAMLLLDDAQRTHSKALSEAGRNAEQTLKSHIAELLADAVKLARSSVSSEQQRLEQLIATAQSAHHQMNQSAEELESGHRKANARIISATANLEKMMAEAISEAELKVAEMTMLASQMNALTNKTSAAIEEAVRKASAAPLSQPSRKVMIHDVS